MDLLFKLFSFSLALLASATTARAQRYCPLGFMYFGNKCYHVGLNPEHYQRAEIFCNGINASMATVHSLLETSYISIMLPTHNTSGWLGATVTGPSVTDFQWLDASPKDFRQWGPGEPNKTSCNMDNECCAIRIYHGKWYNTPCTASVRPVCERYAYDQEKKPQSRCLSVGLQENVCHLEAEVEEMKAVASDKSLSEMKSAVKKATVHIAELRNSCGSKSFNTVVTVLLAVLFILVLSIIAFIIYVIKKQPGGTGFELLSKN